MSFDWKTLNFCVLALLKYIKEAIMLHPQYNEINETILVLLLDVIKLLD